MGVEGDGEMADYNIPSDVCWRLSVYQRRESDSTSVAQNLVPTFKNYGKCVYTMIIRDEGINKNLMKEHLTLVPASVLE